MQVKWKVQGGCMGKLLDKIKKKLESLESKGKKEIGERNVKSSKTFPRQKAPLK
jgi:predicted AlkP superfamily phosphohydrolase/phosphomutase